MTSRDFLHEYVEEVNEHLQELESSLLVLEREGSNREEIGRIFRAAHSIKGASAYMGFEGLADLTHELESLISRIQTLARHVTPAGISVMLACIDFISGAVRHLQETGEEPPLPPTLLEDIHGSLRVDEASDASIPETGTPTRVQSEIPSLVPSEEGTAAEDPDLDVQRSKPRERVHMAEDDQELFKIYLKYFEEILHELSRLVNGSIEAELTEADFERAINLIGRLIASSTYMDYNQVEDVLSSLKASFLEAFHADGHTAHRQVFIDMFELCCGRLQRIVPGLEVPGEGSSRSRCTPGIDNRVDDDEELFSIFADAFREVFGELQARTSNPPEAVPTLPELESCRALIRRLVLSSQYMDYEDLVRALDEWDNTLKQTLEDGTLAWGIFGELLAEYAERIRQIIPALELPVPGDNSPPPAGPNSAMREEDEELLAIFIDSFQQGLAEIAGRMPASNREFLGEDDYGKTLEQLNRLISSSQYMDYQEVVESLKEWMQSLREIYHSGMADRETLIDVAEGYGRRFEEMIFGLSIPLFDRATTGDLGETEIDDEIDATFDEIERLATPDDLLPQDLASEDMSPDEGFADGEVGAAGAQSGETENRALSFSSDRALSKRGRVVTVAEEIAPSATLRVDARKVDRLLNQVGELVVTRSEFIQTSLSFRDILREIAAQGRLSKAELRRFRALSFRLNESTLSLGRVANDLQDSVMRIRMLPISFLFQRFPRVVRDQALKLGRKVELLVEGGETEIDKRVLEQMHDPLVQFLRNAVVHGIESPEERRKASKPGSGVIRLSAYHQGDYVSLEIEDDGRGIQVNELREILKTRKELSVHELDRLSDQELMYAVFLPGISTHTRVDGSAGRGVGLDVVKENVERMNGSIEVESVPGMGTRFIIRIPLTVAIIRALLVRGGEHVFTLPLSSVSEIIRYGYETTHTIEGFQVISLRGKTIPLVHLGRLLQTRVVPSENAGKSIVIVSTSFREVGLVVDGLLGEREVVIKPIEDAVHSFEGFSGATILGDGTVSLILDVSALLRIMKDAFGRPQLSESRVH
jgi:two-component system chemotaxis sensor kinase CheA